MTGPPPDPRVRTTSVPPSRSSTLPPQYMLPHYGSRRTVYTSVPGPAPLPSPPAAPYPLRASRSSSSASLKAMGASPTVPVPPVPSVPSMPSVPSVSQVSSVPPPVPPKEWRGHRSSASAAVVGSGSGSGPGVTYLPETAPPPVPPPPARALSLPPDIPDYPNLLAPLPDPEPISPSYSTASAQVPSRPSSSSDSASVGSGRASGSASTRTPLSPRRRFVKGRGTRLGQAGLPSPRRRERDRGRERRRPPDRPSLGSTLGHLAGFVRWLLLPLQVVLGPVMWHAANAAVLVVLVMVGVYVALILVRSLVASLVARVGLGLGFFGGQSTGVLDTLAAIPAAVGMLPVRALATPACLLANIGCSTSLLASDAPARPIWQILAPGSGNVDVALVSRELSKEVRYAKDIFDSLLALGDGRMTEGLGHVRIHELGIAIQHGSSLEDRFFIGQELIELADLASELTDEIVMINAMSVNVFSWLFWEFSTIAGLLDLPASRRPAASRLGPRLDSLINRLDRELDRLYTEVDGAIPVATRGKDKGWQLLEHLSGVTAGLRDVIDRFPGWQRVLDVSRRFIRGGDPGKLTRVSRDLELTRSTIAGLDVTSKSLERVRVDLTAFRTQVRSFKGSIMGLHLGASEEIGLGPEQEMAILHAVVDELGSAVGRAKRRPMERERGIEGPEV